VHSILLQGDKLQIMIQFGHLLIKTVLPVYPDTYPESSPSYSRQGYRLVRLWSKPFNGIREGLIELNLDKVG
jgi:hypothetical protein